MTPRPHPLATLMKNPWVKLNTPLEKIASPEPILAQGMTTLGIETLGREILIFLLFTVVAELRSRSLLGDSTHGGAGSSWEESSSVP